ncbi:MAG: NAD(P)-dependent glycerol-3-phosphate dehydrogenase, partial [Actinobacteria bacterium]|nr:NAD(P)-dependent glycerol-3-phosphate dehydrogenase [Actinomycetota bacterium]
VCRLLAPLLRPGTGVLSACKGLEPETLLRMTQVIAEEIPPSCLPRVAALSGPNFAVEVGHGLPTATVVASEDPAVGRTFQDALMTPRFRVYTNRDVVGVELGGALKNVIAIGVGIAEGLEVGYNAQAALITRGLAEIARLGTAVGAQPLTFSGLSGMGDLVLTCTGELSRNRRVGIDLGRGKTLDQATAGGRVVAEGVRTTRAAYSLSQQLGIRMPITEQVYHVLFNGRDPREGVMALMCRGKNTEVDE